MFSYSLNAFFFLLQGSLFLHFAECIQASPIVIDERYNQHPIQNEEVPEGTKPYFGKMTQWTPDETGNTLKLAATYTVEDETLIGSLAPVVTINPKPVTTTFSVDPTSYYTDGAWTTEWSTKTSTVYSTGTTWTTFWYVYSDGDIADFITVSEEQRRKRATSTYEPMQGTAINTDFLTVPPN